MKKLILVGLLLLGPRFAFADNTPPSVSITNVLPSPEPAVEPAPPNEPSVYVSFGKLNILLPFSEVSAVYLYDFVNNKNLLGGETPIAQYWKLQGTVGAVISTEGKGSPFIGTHLALPNPLPNFAALSHIKPGLFGGYDFNAKAWMGGLKVSTSIFQ